jgi:hypothetical protein
MKGSKRITLGLALAATLGLMAAPAPAGKATKSKLKITSLSATGAAGTLGSRKATCEKRRKVALQFQGEYTPVRVGSDKTDAKGRWKIDGNLESGIYYATTKAVKRGKTKCAAATSKNKRLG